MAIAPANVRQDNQGLVCDAVVRVLEQTHAATRSDVTHPERAGGPGAVDLLFSLDADRYALEHTQIDRARPPWLDELFFIYTTTSYWTVHRWDWEDSWWEEGYSDFDPGRLVDAFAR